MFRLRIVARSDVKKSEDLYNHFDTITDGQGDGQTVIPLHVSRVMCEKKKISQVANRSET